MSTETQQLDTHNVHQQQGAVRAQRTRLWVVLRIIDNRVQALAPSNPEDRESEPDWTDLGGETCMWEDRETAFQIGRANGGLLVSADGIPGPHRMTSFHDRLRALRTALAAQSSVVSGSAQRTVEEQEAKNAADMAAGAAKKARGRTVEKAPAQDDEAPF